MFKTDKEILMYFHTSLRNVGLFTSIALAMQAYSMRMAKSNDTLKSTHLYLAHLLFLALGIYVNLLFIQDLKKSKDSFKSVIENRWINIPYITVSFLSILFIMNFYTLTTRLFTKSK